MQMQATVQGALLCHEVDGFCYDFMSIWNVGLPFVCHCRVDVKKSLDYEDT